MKCGTVLVDGEGAMVCQAEVEYRVRQSHGHWQVCREHLLDVVDYGIARYGLVAVDTKVNS